MTDEYSLRDYGLDGKIIHTPGHTAGSISVAVGKRAFVGDTAQKIFPLSGRSYVPILAEDLEEVARSWRKILDCGVQTIYPAHGKSFPAKKMKSIGVRSQH